MSIHGQPGSSGWRAAIAIAFADGLARKLLLFFGAAFSSIFALRIVGRVDQFVLLWPVSGMAVALSLPLWPLGREKRMSLMLATATGVLIGCVLSGQPTWLATYLAALTCLDMIIAGAILCPHVTRFDDLKQRSNMLRFAVASTIAPMLSGTLGAIPVANFLHAPFLQTSFMSVLANSLGMAVVIPSVLFLVNGEFRSFRKLTPHLRRGLLTGMPFVAVASVIFWQNKGPFLFVIFPPMIFVLLALGLEGAVLTSISLSAIGWIATSHGHGPIMLVHNSSPEFRLLILQVFIWISLATALPVGALIDERKRAERSAEESQSIYQLLLQNAQEAIVLSSIDGSRRYASPAITTLTGWTPVEYVALDRRDTLHPDDRELAKILPESLAAGSPEQTVRYRIMHKNGDWRWVEAVVRPYGGEEVAGYVGTIRDISALKQREEVWQIEHDRLSAEKLKLASLAHTDPLTGLLNRRGLDETLRQQTENSTKSLSILMIDVDFFKLYNDTYGHQKGDQCLIQLAAVLRGQAGRKGDLVARMGGEEFIVVLPGTSQEGALAVANRILRALTKTAIEHNSSPRGFVTASIGVATSPNTVEPDLDLLVNQADIALYASKSAGKNCATPYEGSLGDKRA